MQKVHVEQAIKLSKAQGPGPDRYATKDHFGLRQGEIACTSRQYSMGKKIDHMKHFMRETAQKPGPGAYTTINRSDMGQAASLNASPKGTIPQGNRFKTTDFAVPPPNRYSVMATTANAKH